ncbi:unknown [Bacteroides fragilis CAG:47]|jgi:hypothetical protein|nr:unknown [Bacteroides fragilis CAG:47]
MLNNVFQREFVSNAFRTAQVRTDDDATTVCQNLLQGRKCSTDTSVVCNVEVFVQGYIEVHANECLFTGKIEIVNCLHNTLFIYFKSVSFFYDDRKVSINFSFLL